jgi:hypothetical protein
MSSTMNGNRQERKILTIECKALKWGKMNITLTSSHGRWDDYDIAFMIAITIKHGRLKMHRMHKQNG